MAIIFFIALVAGGIAAITIAERLNRAEQMETAPAILLTSFGIAATLAAVIVGLSIANEQDHVAAVGPLLASLTALFVGVSLGLRASRRVLDRHTAGIQLRSEGLEP